MSLPVDLLYALEAARGAGVPEAALARRLGAPTDALRRAAATLWEDGFALKSDGQTCTLAAGEERLTERGVRLFLPAGMQSLPVFCYDAIDSTNTEAKRKLEAGLDGEALLVSTRQTAGRGRNGHTFYSPASGLYLTLILHTGASLEDTVCVTAAAAVAAVQAIGQLTVQRPLIKWVNDLFVDGKKVAGILAETGTGFRGGVPRQVIVGMGLNIGPTAFPPELREIAGALELGGVTRSHLAAEIAGRLYVLGHNLADRSFFEDYRRHSMVLGREIDYFRGGRAFRATAVGIDDSGGLLVRDADGTRRVLHSGEISLRLHRA